jgi:hypothetical protein
MKPPNSRTITSSQSDDADALDVLYEALANMAEDSGDEVPESVRIWGEAMRARTLRRLAELRRNLHR